MPTVGIFLSSPSLPLASSVVSSCPSSPLNLSPGETNATLPGEGSDPVTSGNHVYVAWSSASGGNSEVLFSASHDEGESFGPPLLLSNNSRASGPRLATIGESVYATWVDTSVSNGVVLFRASHDNGSTFGPAIDLSGGYTASHGPQISESGNSVFVAWVASAAGVNTQIILRASQDGGSTFGPAINLSNDNGPTQEVAIASSLSNVYVTWEDQSTGLGQIGYDVSHDAGVTFLKNALDISNVPSPQHAREPLFAVSGSRLYVVWRTDNDLSPDNSDIFLLVSMDNRTTFTSGPENLSNNPGISRMDSVTASQSSLYLIWRDNQNGTYDIYYVASHDNGTTFSHVVNLGGGTGLTVVNQVLPYDDHPRLDSNGSSVYATWDADISNNYEVFFRASHDNGTTFGPVLDLSNDPGKSASPEVAAGSNYTAVMWVSGTGQALSPNVYVDSCPSMELPSGSTLTSVGCPATVAVNTVATCSAAVFGDNGTVPTGTITFSDSGSAAFNPGTCSLSSGTCKVTYTANPGSEGLHTITASYGGDSLDLASQGSYKVTVTQRPSTTTVSCSPGTDPVNAPVTCTAKATDSGTGTPITPTGTFSFSSSSSGTFAKSSCALASGSCSVTYTPNPGSEGKQTITANYGGDSNHQGSAASSALTATKRTVIAVLSCPSPYKLRSPITCTMTLTDTSPGTPLTPSGAVTFTSVGSGRFSSSTCILSGAGKTASCSTQYTPSSTGNHTVTGTFLGTVNQGSAAKSTKFKVA